MKLGLILGTFVLITTAYSVAQNFNSAPSESLSLEIGGKNGNNGLAVVYNKKKDIYYSVFAGNASYPVEVHKANGMSIYSNKIGVDVRGMWYDKKCKCLTGTVYGNKKTYKLDLDKTGMPLSTTTEAKSYGLEGQGHTVGSKKYIYSLNTLGVVLKMKKSGDVSKGIAIKRDYSDFSNLNKNGIVYTGIKGFEIGFINVRTSSLELFSEKTGRLTKSIKIDLMSGKGMPSNFNVAYANKHLFIFDKQTRNWKGFKIIN